jgi:hypothetical protein
MSLQILTPPPSTLLVTPDLARAAGVTALPTPHLLTFLTAASAALEAHCHRAFARATVQEDLEDQGLGLWLSHCPVLHITSIVSGGMVIPTYLLMDAETGSLQTPLGVGTGGWAGGLFPSEETEEGRFPRACLVVYTGGYVLPGWEEAVTLPEPLQWACLETVKVWSVRPETEPRTLPPHILATIAPYRRHRRR